VSDLVFKEKVRHLLEAMLTALLFCTQTILAHFGFISLMAIPLLPYLTYLLIGQLSVSAEIEIEVHVYLFASEFIVGRIIAFAGLAVLLIAAAQFLQNRSKGAGLIRAGLYSRVRHPQFMGIITITSGLTVIVLTLVTSNKPQIIGLWLIQVLGYIGIARYEETHLLKKFGESFSQYRRDVPFMFPIRSPRRIPETVFTVLIAVLVCFLFLVFPFNLIRIL
jgi:protein-S-isoprenylcysteine O-methyltransferase Ste14